MAKLEIHSGADDDFLESYLYYAKQSRRAAERFDEQVRAAFDKVAADPMGGTAYDQTHRFYSLKNYPHLILYRYDGDTAIVVAVYHPSREPGYWRNSVKDQWSSAKAVLPYACPSFGKRMVFDGGDARPAASRRALIRT
jgi:plasmid stabilization system protein ParE